MHGDKQCTDWADMLTSQVGSCDDSLSEVPGYSHYALCHIQPSARVFTIITIVTLKKEPSIYLKWGVRRILDFSAMPNWHLIN